MKVPVATMFFSILVSLSVNMSPCWADDNSAYDQAAAVEDSSEDAAGYANSGDYEDVASAAGLGFDTRNPA